MPSVIRQNGRIVTASRDYRPGLTAGYAPPLSGDVALKPEDRRSAGDRDVPLGAPVPSDSPDSPLRAGIPYEDPQENVVYRVIANLNVAEGWGTAAFWTKRWNCHHTDILHFAQLGWLDAAIAAGSPVKRYRCRDEDRCVAWLKERERQAWQRMQKQLTQELEAAPKPTSKPFSKPRTKPTAFSKVRKWGGR